MVDALSREASEAEFQRFCDAMDLVFDVERMDADDKSGFEKLRNLFVRMVQNGSLVVGDNGEPVYTPRHDANKSPITFKVPTGAAMIAMDKEAKGQDAARSFAFMAETTGELRVRFGKMDGRDLKVCNAIAGLFLASE